MAAATNVTKVLLEELDVQKVVALLAQWNLDEYMADQ